MSSDSVRVWCEPVVLPTYEPLPPERHPMFLERRVYQGSSGKVYPLPFYTRIAEEPVEKAWHAVHIENEYLYVMILPDIGGRIHILRDKTNDYDVIYRQDTIKPALVGLAGPWISGGIEFNWPQHHRPATYQPTDVSIEHEEDGSVTVWLSDHDPMTRMKGMHGVCLRPGVARLELKARLYNRTDDVQTFLWWANVATRVHERYQSFFPTDVHMVADHAKRATSTYPHCSDRYYGVDYHGRAVNGVPTDEMPSRWVPTGEYSPDDLSWYANIPVPTSYMCTGTREDFFGGYDHAVEAGIVHVADHTISPGKKQWTWGNHEFGYAWDRLLSEDEGPYIELMAGVFTDNQPDFAFLQPFETKTFTQYWYPIQKIGPAVKANEDFAISVRSSGGVARVGVASVRDVPNAQITVKDGDQVLWEEEVHLAPDQPFVRSFTASPNLEVSVPFLSFRREEGLGMESTLDPATEPPSPTEIASNDELFITGLHLEQYRHATRSPLPYWEEALRRDPEDSRCNNAIGRTYLRSGEFELAERYFRTAINRLTRRNPNPYDSEPYYNLGVTLRYLHRDAEAYEAFGKASWNETWKVAAWLQMARIRCVQGNQFEAKQRLEAILKRDAECLAARNLYAMLLEDCEAWNHDTLRIDPLDAWALWLSGTAPTQPDIALDLALDFKSAGFTREAAEVLKQAVAANPTDGTLPLLLYHLSALEPGEWLAKAQAADPRWCFPARLEDIAVLEQANDPRAAFYLGNLYYDRRRYGDAVAAWEKAVEGEPKNAVAWRNLGIAYFNRQNRPQEAKAAYEKAFAASPDDGRVFYERDQLWKKLGVTPSERATEYERHQDLVGQRDDLSLEWCGLLNQLNRAEEALAILGTRKFQPWEGGEGVALGEWTRAHLLLARQALSQNPIEAEAHARAALAPPLSLGECRHLLANASEVWLLLGDALHAQDKAEAEMWWRRAAEFKGDFQDMSVRPYSDLTLFSALALQRLGRTDEADALLRGLSEYAEQLSETKAKIDYFATSLPTMLLFEDDLDVRQQMLVRLLRAQVAFGEGQSETSKQILLGLLQEDANYARAADLLRYVE